MAMVLAAVAVAVAAAAAAAAALVGVAAMVDVVSMVAAVGPPMIGNSQSSVATAIPVRHLMGASMLSNSNRHTETSNRQAHSNPNIHKPLPPLLNSITASITMVEAALNNSNRDRIGLRLTPEVA